MEIKVQSIRFDADQKLLDFIEKKLGKLNRYFDNIIRTDVTLSLEPDHGKKVQAKIAVPGDELVVERCAGTFEDAVVAVADALQEMLVKTKEKRYGK
mgnify:CR=1 FL=1